MPISRQKDDFDPLHLSNRPSRVNKTRMLKIGVDMCLLIKNLRLENGCDLPTYVLAIGNHDKKTLRIVHKFRFRKDIP